MSLALRHVLVRDYFHEFYKTPFLERFATCPDRGGIGNTPVEQCMACGRFRGLKDSSWGATALCSGECKEKPKEKRESNHRETPKPGAKRPGRKKAYVPLQS